MKLQHIPVILSLLSLPLTAAMAQGYTPQTVRHAGPFEIKSPIVLDSINISQEKYSASNLINTPLSLGAADHNPQQTLSSLTFEKGTLNLISFGIEAPKYLSTGVKVTGAEHYKVYVDGSAANGSALLQPGYHTFAVKFIADSTGLAVELDSALMAYNAAAISSTPSSSYGAGDSAKRKFTMVDNLGMHYIHDAAISPSGRWAVVTASWYDKQNKYVSERLLVDTKTSISSEIRRGVTWMPRTDRYYYTESESGKTRIIVVDPATGAKQTLVDDLPSQSFTMSPTEDYLILHDSDDGPKKEDGVYEITHPDDRQPGWRNRGRLSKYDLKTGFVQPLTYTYRQLWLSDISLDGRYLLFAVNNDSLTQRPTTRSTYYELDLTTMKSEILVEKDGFIGSASYAGKSNERLVFKASTEAFGGIGKQLPEGLTPNMFDYHLYIMERGADAASNKVIPVTADHRTSIESVLYSAVDDAVYYTAQNGDSVSLYRLEMKNYKSVRIPQPLEVLTSLNLATVSGDITVCGSSPCVPYQAYKLSSKYLISSAKTAGTKNASARNNASGIQLIADPNKDFANEVALGTVKPWQFTCKRGYDVSGFFFLPVDFDESKKYPVIVHYYGGCSPTSRRFGNGSHYPAHYWNALGYIVFIVNPSGASGFGQEWASRHVNTMGEGVAQDIIEATEQFAKDVPQVDADHIGCVSASYGGFMTQCMMTKTDLFACGISHAGISDHTSYWGEGYWGYSYSEVSAANSYPWTRKDLFVDRSPLFNADKIHKPILFTHGTADTNVPIGESIQMYTALKLLGIPTAFIMVEGENHGIMDPAKRTKWINSMTAWFHKYLKNDSSWWESIYTKKSL